jgi:hypothetical protein
MALHVQGSVQAAEDGYMNFTWWINGIVRLGLAKCMDQPMA